MSAKMINKMKEFLGLDEYDEMEEYEEEYEEEIEEKEDFEPVIPSGRKAPNKVVNIHTASSAKVSIVRPIDFAEATEICDDLKNRKIIVINTTSLDLKIAQRLLDFVSGACYALGGEFQEVEKGVYILSPSNVEVTKELKSELSSKGIFNWNK
ncbi:cell division protein SepF [Clostridium polynesiense]|uniref:cell division protein SepF n=1 Tax=Clostridium polynesiense TaxID=1325933 RepID=UPI000590CE59|nr:cell division protein SepF [Clostridium polynesiense]